MNKREGEKIKWWVLTTRFDATSALSQALQSQQNLRIFKSRWPWFKGNITFGSIHRILQTHTKSRMDEKRKLDHSGCYWPYIYVGGYLKIKTRQRCCSSPILRRHMQSKCCVRETDREETLEYWIAWGKLGKTATQIEDVEYFQMLNLDDETQNLKKLKNSTFTGLCCF